MYDLYTGSWIDEFGSAPGVDLGTWIGEPEENAAWELLSAVRRALSERRRAPGYSERNKPMQSSEGPDRN